MPLTPMMPGCVTPNGPPYHYNEPIPPAPTSSALTTSQSQSSSAFQQKLTTYHQQQQQQQHPHHHHHHHHLQSSAVAHMDTSHAQSVALQKPVVVAAPPPAQTHSHFTSSGSQYQESYPHTQTYNQQPPPPAVPLHVSSQHQPVSAASSFLATVSQSQVPHYTQSYQLNGTQQQVNFFFFLFHQEGEKNYLA